MIALGLDSKLFLKDKNISKEERFISEAILSEKLDYAIDNNFKFLYNESINYDTFDQTTNLLNYHEGFTFYALNQSNSFNYFEKIYDYKDDSVPYLDNFEKKVINYIFPIFRSLNTTCHNRIFISDEKSSVEVDNIEYFFMQDLEDESHNLSILPIVDSYENFKNKFMFYFWFYSRKNKDNIQIDKILLTDNFINQIKTFIDEDIKNVITSIFRSVYYPDFLSSKGVIEECVHIIETHPDKSTKAMEINNTKQDLYRVHCVSSTERKGGKNRICYSNYENKAIFFYYNSEHCEEIDYNEDINIKSNVYTLHGKEELAKKILLKARK